MAIIAALNHVTHYRYDRPVTLGPQIVRLRPAPHCRAGIESYSLKVTPARMVLYAAYQDPRPSEWLQRNAGVAAVKLPFTVGGTDGAKDLFGLFDDTVARLLAAGAAK